MKRKPFGTEAPKLHKTSISLPEVLARYAEQRCVDEGYTSFSAYLCDLLRRDKDEREKRKAALPRFPSPEQSALNETPK